MGSHSMAEVQPKETIFLSNLVRTKLCRSFTGPPEQAEIVREARQVAILQAAKLCMHFLGLDYALQRAFTTLIEFETLYFAEYILG